MSRRYKALPCAMTIAGSDSGGGAGVEADLKTFSALGVYGTCVVTAVTAQNTLGVYGIHPIPPDFVRRQIEAVMEDVGVDAAKTGMLYSGEVVMVVSEAIDKYDLRVVVDPVLRAGSGDLLMRVEDVEALRECMVPRATVLTPNRYEAEVLSGVEIGGLREAEEAARELARLGAEAVVLKGGHLEGEVVHDILYYDGRFRSFEKPRFDLEPHGGGCVFSAAIAGYLALGEDIPGAVERAEVLIQDALRFSFRVGGGRRPVNPLASLYNDAEKFHVLEEVRRASKLIEGDVRFLPYIAEVGTQVAMALPYASGRSDVAAVEGRIVKLHVSSRAVGPVEFGASRHMANVILTAMRHNPNVRAALNLHYDPKLVEAFKRAGFTVSMFDRSLEPVEVKAVEGRTLRWGVEEAIKRAGCVPDVIYDLGEVGKEPMIRVLGRTATEVVSKALKAIAEL